MSHGQIAILVILTASAAMFMWGRWRHDMVALGALLACVLTGLVPATEAFLGFGHPAVITVACVLILSRGLQEFRRRRRAVEPAALPTSTGPTLTIAAISGLAAVLSAFMNNVGALALLMPVALQIASSRICRPAKCSCRWRSGRYLGGMTTLIGTPPNLIVSSFRASNGGQSFAMFDYTPVGLAVAAVGVAFVASCRLASRSGAQRRGRPRSSRPAPI